MTKASKTAVHYTPHAEKHEERCGLCKYFQAPHACALVLGKINRAGWCEEFERARPDR